ncbi:6-cysteine protein [Plasmodium vivax]|uniref:6-cysteine protein n=1 Tax=Plasmodium vivax TaxID=5855 RepID=A0A1G4HEW0_PLAVI|nr:6-cysteine protein [Plasmodium vivax]
MHIFKLVSILLLPFFKSLPSCADVSLAGEFQSKLAYDGGQIVYSKKPFKGSIYAFSPIKGKCAISVKATTDGVEWESKSNIEVEDGVGGATIFSLFTTDEITAIFRCSNVYYIAKMGGENFWKNIKQVTFSDFPVDAIPAVYSGSYLLMNSEYEKFILVCSREDPNGSERSSDGEVKAVPFSELQLLGRCKFSFDEGNTWKEGATRMYSDELSNDDGGEDSTELSGDNTWESVKEVNISAEEDVKLEDQVKEKSQQGAPPSHATQLSLTQMGGKLAIKAVNVRNGGSSSKTVILVCNSLYKNDLYCDKMKLQINDKYILHTYEVVNGYHMAVLREKNGTHLVPSFVYNLSETFEPILHYKSEKNREGKSDVGEGNPLDKAAYEFVSGKGEVVYLFCHTVGGHNKVIKINAPERKPGCEVLPDGEANKGYSHTFSIQNMQNERICKVPTSELGTTQDGFFKVFYVTLPKGVSLNGDCFTFSFSKELKSEYHTAVVRRANGGSAPHEGEAQFYFPLYYSKFLYNYKKTYCTLSNGLKIAVEFDYIRNILDLNYADENDVIKIGSNDTVVHAKRRYVQEKGGDVFPRGTYLNSYLPFEKEYVISNFVPEGVNQTSSIVLPHGAVRKLHFVQGGEVLPYDGIDLLAISPNYKKLTKYEMNRKSIDVIVSNFKSEEKIIGLVCPVSSQDEGLTCFDKVYLQKGGRLHNIGFVFGSNDIFVIPQRRLLRPGGKEAMESLLYLNKRNVDKLKKEKQIIHFSCECKGGEGTEPVHVNYYVSAHYDYEFVKAQVGKPGGSAFVNGHLVEQRGEAGREGTPGKTADSADLTISDEDLNLEEGLPMFGQNVLLTMLGGGSSKGHPHGASANVLNTIICTFFVLVLLACLHVGWLSRKGS